MLAELLPKLLPLLGVGLGDLKGPPGDAHRLGRHPHAPRVQAREGVGQAPPLLPEEVLLGDEDLLEAHLGGVSGVEAHLLLWRPEGKPGRIPLHQKGADPLLRAGHDHVKMGLPGGGDPAFHPVQHKPSGNPPGLGVEAFGVGARLGLGEAEGPDPLPPGQGEEILALLRLGAEAEKHVLGKAARHGDDDGHAGISGGDLLQGQGPGHGVQAHSSPRLRGGHAEEAELGQGLELGPGVLGLPVVLGGEGVEDLPGHPAHRIQNQPLFLGEGHPPYRNTAGRRKSVTFPPTGGRASREAPGGPGCAG